MDMPVKWWLIADDDVQHIRVLLELLLDTWQKRGMPKCSEATVVRRIMALLDMGLNTTEAVPDDFKVNSED